MDQNENVVIDTDGRQARSELVSLLNENSIIIGYKSVQHLKVLSVSKRKFLEVWFFKALDFTHPMIIDIGELFSEPRTTRSFDEIVEEENLTVSESDQLIAEAKLCIALIKSK